MDSPYMKSLYASLAVITKNDMMHALRQHERQLLPPIDDITVSNLPTVMVATWGLISLTCPKFLRILTCKGFLARLGLPYQLTFDLEGYSKKLFELIKQERVFTSEAFHASYSQLLPERTCEASIHGWLQY